MQIRPCSEGRCDRRLDCGRHSASAPNYHLGYNPGRGTLVKEQATNMGRNRQYSREEMIEHDEE
jgi:hypothetical protein